MGAHLSQSLVLALHAAIKMSLPSPCLSVMVVHLPLTSAGMRAGPCDLTKAEVAGEVAGHSAHVAAQLGGLRGGDARAASGAGLGGLLPACPACVSSLSSMPDPAWGGRPPDRPVVQGHPVVMSGVHCTEQSAQTCLCTPAISGAHLQQDGVAGTLRAMTAAWTTATPTEVGFEGERRGPDTGSPEAGAGHAWVKHLRMCCARQSVCAC